jgi:hypothetical protein
MITFVDSDAQAHTGDHGNAPISSLSLHGEAKPEVEYLFYSFLVSSDFIG